MIKFQESNHSYVNDKGEKYQSVTGFIKGLHEAFEREKTAIKFAKKHKRTVEDVLAEWDKVGKDAIEKGNKYHKLKEDELLLKGNILIDDELHSVIKYDYSDGCKVSDSMVFAPGVYVEPILWSDRYMLAGQSDIVEITKQGKINIKDYKTSKEIATKSFVNWEGISKKMLFPLHNLEDCNFNHYSLQLNLYAYMIKIHNRDLEIGTMTIEHVEGSFVDDEFIINKVTPYDVPDMQRDVKIALEYWQNKKI